jgi:hypothetical protein
MNRKVITALLSAAFLAAPLFAGALTLVVSDPGASPDAQAKHAAVMVRTTACNSPEKTVVTAAAEGIVSGRRQTIPLKVIGLAAPGVFAVQQQWPRDGVWTVRFTATNPDYKNYATGVVVPVHDKVYSSVGAKVFYHAPTDEDVNSVLKQATLE